MWLLFDVVCNKNQQLCENERKKAVIQTYTCILLYNIVFNHFNVLRISFPQKSAIVHLLLFACLLSVFFVVVVEGVSTSKKSLGSHPNSLGYGTCKSVSNPFYSTFIAHTWSSTIFWPKWSKPLNTCACSGPTLLTVGIKVEYCFPNWNTSEHSVSMAVLRSSGQESSVLIIGWMIREAKSVRSSDSLRRSRVSRAHLRKKKRLFFIYTMNQTAVVKLSCPRNNYIVSYQRNIRVTFKKRIPYVPWFYFTSVGDWFKKSDVSLSTNQRYRCR